MSKQSHILRFWAQDFSMEIGRGDAIHSKHLFICLGVILNFV